jgi:hypothetical protein
VVVPGQPGFKFYFTKNTGYRLPITNRSLMNHSSKFGVYFVVSCSKIKYIVARWTTDEWQVLVHICEAYGPDNQFQKPWPELLLE